MDANTNQYINLDTKDRYWNKIFERTGQDIKNELLQNYKHIVDNGSSVAFTIELIKYFDINNEFIVKNGLSNNVRFGY